MIGFLFADEGDTQSGGILGVLPLMLVMGGAMYFLMIRPQKKRMAAAKLLASSITDGDEVMTTSGMYGFVNAIDGDTIWLEIAENVEIRISRSAVLRKVDPTKEAAGGALATGTPADSDAQAGDGDNAGNK